jgi:hypothetical protein
LNSMAKMNMKRNRQSLNCSPITLAKVNNRYKIFLLIVCHQEQ